MHPEVITVKHLGSGTMLDTAEETAAAFKWSIPEDVNWTIQTRFLSEGEQVTIMLGVTLKIADDREVTINVLYTDKLVWIGARTLQELNYWTSDKIGFGDNYVATFWNDHPDILAWEQRGGGFGA